MPPFRYSESGEKINARLDRNNQLVYGLPNQVPGNDWKKASTCWQSEFVSLGKPLKQEPRFLGYTWRGDPFTNAWFPDDASNHIPPADRKLIEHPWDKGLTDTENEDNISLYTWAVIARALDEYHKILGFPDSKRFSLNPDFRSGFNSGNLEKYFKVLSEPRPGVAGTVRHWHYRADLGGIYYDTITVEWEVLPDFIIKDNIGTIYLDPGTDKAAPGETYQGRLTIVTAPEAGALKDPLTKRMYSLLYGSEVKLTKDYTIPVGIMVDKNLVGFQGYPETPQIKGIYLVTVSQGAIHIDFNWSLPPDFNATEIKLAAEINDSSRLFPDDPNKVISHIDSSENNLQNNYAEVVMPTTITHPDFWAKLIPDHFESESGKSIEGIVRFGLDEDYYQPEKAWLRLDHVVDGTYHSALLEPINPADALDANGQIMFDPGEVKEYRFRINVQAGSEKIVARINPISTNEDRDWSNNRAEAPIILPVICTDISVKLTRSPSGERIVGDNTQLTATVTRARNGPQGPVNVRFKFGHGTWQNFTLNQGQSRTFKNTVVHGQTGSITYLAEAWPVGIEDCNPANNKATVSIPVEARFVPPDDDDDMNVGLTGGR